MRPVIIEVGLNESTRRESNPHVPYSAEEVAEDILRCGEAGASIVHFHSRDAASGVDALFLPGWGRKDDIEFYGEAMRRVREAGSDILMYPTYPLLPLGRPSDALERFEHVFALAEDPELAPHVAPVDMGSWNVAFFAGGGFVEVPEEFAVSVNTLPHILEVVRRAVDRGLLLSLAAFEPGHLRTILACVEQGLVTKPMVKLFMSDQWLQGPWPDRDGLEGYLRLMDRVGPGRDHVEWIAVPYAMSSKAAADDLRRAALELGGHIRVGIGDNPDASGGRSNAELVREAVERAAEAGRPVATVDGVRKTFAV